MNILTLFNNHVLISSKDIRVLETIEGNNILNQSYSWRNYGNRTRSGVEVCAQNGQRESSTTPRPSFEDEIA